MNCIAMLILDKRKRIDEEGDHAMRIAAMLCMACLDLLTCGSSGNEDHGYLWFAGDIVHGIIFILVGPCP